MKKCRTCGGQLDEIGYGKYKCPWCGSEFAEQDLIKTDNADLEVFALLNKARTAMELEYDFNTSLKFSQSVLEKNPSSQEANWLALLAENQIIYIQNERGKYTPTFLAPEGKSLNSSRYYKALNEKYRADADKIEKLRLVTLEEFRKLKPYDVFISYRQHQSDGNNIETEEAVWARDIYTELKTNNRTKHLNIFFDQKCLTGSNVGWEPHIYSAVKSSKCMIILASSLDNLNSRWVKNEWKRFLAYKKHGDKKDFIVLGGNAVNPLLLDESLQQKQMITNTSGKWLNEICNRVAEICGKPEKEKPEPKIDIPKPKKVKKPLGKKAKIIILSVILAFILALGGSGLGVGLWYNHEMKEVYAVEELISYLPSYELDDYSQYEDLFDAAIESYEALSGWQKNKVENADTLLNVVDSYNTYRVEKLRTIVSGITVDTVEETDNLQSAVTLYGKLSKSQLVLLSSDEIYALEQYVLVYDVVTKLDEISQDILNLYGEVESVTLTYLKINSAYRDYVYNYYLVDTFADLVAFYNSFEFTEVSGGYSIALKDGQTLSGDVELPSYYNGQPVVEIPEAAFTNCRSITSLVIPDTVLTIGAGALEGCNNLESITLPFTGKSETAGQTTETGYEAVFGWIFGYEETYQRKYSSSYVAKGFENTSYEIDSTVWQYTYTTTTSTTSTSGGYYYIYYYNFYIPTTLRTVTVTKQTNIPVAAFNGCSMLTEVEYEKEIEEIGDYSFQNCTSLTSFNSETEGTVDLTGSVETIGIYAFYNCRLITAVVIPENVHVFGEHSFDGCRKIEQLTLTDRITKIGDYAFQGLSLITEVTVYNSTTIIGVGAFEGCNNLESITLPFTGKSETAGQTTETGYEAVFGWIFGYEETYQRKYSSSYVAKGFENTSYEIDSTVWQYTYTTTTSTTSTSGGYYYIYYYNFYIPTTLRTVTVTKQTDIPVAAFNGCSMLTEVIYTDTITSAGDYAFQNCVSPTEATSSAQTTAYTLYSETKRYKAV